MFDGKFWIEGRIVINAYAKDIETLRARLIDMVQSLDEKLAGDGVCGGVLVEKWREVSDEQGEDPVHGIVFDEKRDHGEAGKDNMAMVVRHTDQKYRYE